MSVNSSCSLQNSQKIWGSDMAGDWIKMRTGLANDPSVIAMACALDVGEFEVVGMLHHLWSWADAQSRDGHAAGVTKKWVDRYVHRDGFADSMCSAGWLVIDDSGIKFPNFERHNGKPAKDRALAGERQRKKREIVTQVVTDMSRRERDEDVTREEKRREENKDQDLLSSQEPDDGNPMPSAPKIEKPPFDKIMARYNAICGHSFKGAAEMTEARKKNIVKCWARKVDGKTVFQSGKFWEEYFTWCLRDPHWHGEVGKSWKASLEFVTRHDIVDRVLDEMKLEGVFENGNA